MTFQEKLKQEVQTYSFGPEADTAETEEIKHIEDTHKILGVPFPQPQLGDDEVDKQIKELQQQI